MSQSEKNNECYERTYRYIDLWLIGGIALEITLGVH